MVPDKKMLLTLVRMKMPFGKHKGKLLCDIPEDYLIWFRQNGFPKGKLGEYLANVLEIKSNGLEYIFDKLKKMEEEEE